MRRSSQRERRRGIAPGEECGGKHDERGDDRSGRRQRSRVERSRPAHARPPGDRVRAHCPPGEDADREDEEQAYYRGAEREREPAPMSELHDPRRTSGTGRAAVDRATQPEARRDEHDREGERDEHQREDRSRLECEQRLVADVDPGRQRRVPHQRHHAEVGEDVERDEERGGGDRGPKRGQRDACEHPRSTRAKAARGLLGGRVHAPQSRGGEEVHVRIRGQRERHERTPVAGHLGEALDADRLERLLDESARGERTEQGERRHEARDHERKRCGEAPQAAARQIGAHDQPGERDADDERRDDDAEREDRRVPCQLERRRERRECACVAVGRQRPQGQIRNGRYRAERDEPRCGDEQTRRTAAA